MKMNFSGNELRGTSEDKAARFLGGYFWHDRKIIAGTEWEQEMDRHLLNYLQIILLLVRFNTLWDFGLLLPY